MSDLSRYRARWVRIEKRIAELDLQLANCDEWEAVELAEKRVVAVANLERTIALVHVEELRLFAPDSKLHYTPRGLPRAAKPRKVAS